MLGTSGNFGALVVKLGGSWDLLVGGLCGVVGGSFSLAFAESDADEPTEPESLVMIFIRLQTPHVNIVN